MFRRLGCVLISCWLLAGCGKSEGSGSGDFVGAEGAPTGESASNGPESAVAGTLTAGAWDDNRNYDFFSQYLEDAASTPGAPLLTKEQRDQAHALWSAPQGPKGSLDIAFVVDNTGSMGDEIEYLKVEFDALVLSIKTAFPGVPVRWATIAYQDTSDVYLTRVSDFTSDVGKIKHSLMEMGAGGGGDYPEGVDAALAATMTLDWKSSARLAFWLADAPHHAGTESVVTQALVSAQQLGVHVYPIAASGADALTELTMRSAAQLTGGRYLFLTDDSGVGDPHAEPHIPCYFVTKLDKAVARMVSIELSGNYVEPASADILRTGGDPADGHCQLDGGEVVEVF